MILLPATIPDFENVVEMMRGHNEKAVFVKFFGGIMIFVADSAQDMDNMEIFVANGGQII